MTRRRKHIKRRKKRIGEHKRPPCARCGDATRPVERFTVKIAGRKFARWWLCGPCRAKTFSATRNAAAHSVLGFPTEGTTIR